MFDLKLKNKCNHRIINEPLTIKEKEGIYYVVLRYPANGNGGKIILLEQSELVKTADQRVETPFIMGENSKTLILPSITNIENIYPHPKLYATYWTSAGTCPRCYGQDGLVNDILVNQIGKLNTITGFDSLLQKFKKALITEIGSNYFNIDYGTSLVRLIGKPRTALSILIIQQQINDAADFIIQEQNKNASILSNEERLLKIDNFQVGPSENPKMVNITFNIYNYAYEYKKIEIGL